MLPYMALLIFFYSCASSSADDARKWADFACRRQEINIRVVKGEENAKKELEALLKERDEFSKQLDEKYKGKRAERLKVEEEANKIARKCWQ